MQEVEAKRKLTPADGAHIFYTGIFLVGSYLVKSSDEPVCADQSVHLDVFIDTLFYGLLIWATFTIISLIPRYKNENLRLFFNLLDLMYGLFHIALVIFGATIFYNDKAAVCAQIASQAWFLLQLYLLVTGVTAIIVIVGFGMWVFRKYFRPSDLAGFHQSDL